MHVPVFQQAIASLTSICPFGSSLSDGASPGVLGFMVPTSNSVGLCGSLLSVSEWFFFRLFVHAVYNDHGQRGLFAFRGAEPSCRSIASNNERVSLPADCN